MAREGTIRYHQDAQTLTYRVEGRATMPFGLPLRTHAERAIESGVGSVLVDLRDCTYMDSTFLGTLLTVDKALARRTGSRLQLVAPSMSCSRILEQMGLLDLLPSRADHAVTTWTELPMANTDAGSFKRNITQAHEELAALPGPAGEQFRQVIECMAKAEKSPPARPAE